MRESVQLLPSTGCVAEAVGASASAGKFAAVNDQVLVTNGSSTEPALEDLARASRIARLSRQSGARIMRCHPMMRHCPPRMSLGAG